MLKRILSLLLCVMTVLAAVACSEGVETIPEYSAELEENNLNGDDFILLQDYSYPQYILNASYPRDSLYADYALAHVEKVKNTLNVNIEIKSAGATYDVAAQNLVFACAVGTRLGDIYFADMAGIITAALTDCFYPINIEDGIIDLSDTVSYGTPNMIETMTFNSTPYAVIPNLWPNITPGIIYVIVVNNQMVRKAGLSDYREYVENGTWTWEGFADIIDKGTIVEGDSKVFGLGINPTDLAAMAIINNGVKLIVQNGDSYTTELTSPKTIEALAWAQSLMIEHSASINTSSHGWTTELQDGVSTMCLASNWYATNNLAFVLDDFAVLPFPTGPSADSYDSWRAMIISHGGIAIPITTKDTYGASLIIRELCKPFEAFPDEASLKEYYAQNVYHDPRDAEWVWNLQQTCINHYDRVGGWTVFTTFGASLTTKTPSEMIEANIGSFNNVLEKYIIPNYDYISAYEG